MKTKCTIAIVVLTAVLINACNKEPETLADEVVADSGAVRFVLNDLPYQKLSDYRFYVGNLKDMQPNARVLPYEPINALFSDYAHKSRFIWMPQGVSATYQGDHEVLHFPDGTVMIKNFYYDHVLPGGNRRILETRLIYKKDGHWEFANYKWNEEQTEAYFDLEGSYMPLSWVDDNGIEKSVNFRIPSEAECFTCHKSNMQNTPIGPKPNNLNKWMAYDEGAMNQLEKWNQVGYLTGSLPADIETTVDWTDESQPIDMRFRSYIDVNCSHCHSEYGHCYYRPIRFPFWQTTDENNLGVCIEPQEIINPDINPNLTHIIARGNPERSVLHFRMNTTDVQYRMPLMGRTLVHTEAIEMVEAYINSLTPACN
ncbi:MAG: hypothetical protein ACKVOR_04100 [Flavobacteriales bacterium]